MSTSLDQVLLQGLREVLGAPNGMIALHEPEFIGNESALVQDCLDSTFVSSVGKYVDQFEAMLVEYTGAKHAVAVVNGTAALHIALKLAGVQPQDEVLLPALSFVATANAVAHCGAVPHFLDSCPDTMGVDPVALGDNYPQPRGVAERMFRDLHCAKYLESGSIGLKICLVAEGVVDIFVKDVYLKDWDVAAPHLVLQEAGGVLTQFRGQDFDYQGGYEKQGLVATTSVMLLQEISKIIAGW